MNKPFIELPKLTLKALLDYSTKTYADRPAVQFVDAEPITYAQLAQNVEILQEMLRTYGIKPGDRVALYSENMPNWSAIYFAVTTMGAVIVPILPDFHTSEAMHIAIHAECKAAFVSQKLFEVMLDETQPPEMNLLVITDNLNILKKLSTPSTVDKVLKKSGEQLSKAMEKLGKENKEDEEIIIKEEDLAAIIYTSGTTGNSKGVMLSHKNLVFDATASQKIVDIFSTDRFLSILPLAHTYECTIGMIVPILNGASIHYIQKPPTPTILIKAMSTVKPDFILTVPLVIEKIYKNKILPNFQKNLLIKMLYAIPFVRKKLNKIAGKKLIETFGGKIRFFGVGGASLSPAVEKFLREAQFPYCIGYGLTETAPLLAGTNPSKTKYKAIGPVIPGTELELRDQNKEGIGTLWARGPNVMIGYYKDPEKTAEVIDDEGWFNTEDIGYLDEDGYFFMSGRAKNIIVGSSGENIYPEQIEAAINAQTLVADSLVYDDKGILTARIHLDYDKLDEILGVSKKSETKMHAKVDDLLENIRLEINENISAFSRIRKVIEQREEFIKTPTKKIKRYLYTES
ncbi:MAG: long-chain fatty acid--CoA ligase [Epsilonproteobacteria bacterium 4484_65]|nr:MAG: long-chain fatty acid--CoA ligase [Epsilonproteobacteria bacterium 4484_65]